MNNIMLATKLKDILLSDNGFSKSIDFILNNESFECKTIKETKGIVCIAIELLVAEKGRLDIDTVELDRLSNMLCRGSKNISECITKVFN